MAQKALPKLYMRQVVKLVAAIESRTPDLVLSPGARRVAVRGLASRLQHSRTPDQLLKIWARNVNTYAQRANDMAAAQKGILEQDEPYRATEQFVLQQFGLCSQICPPPLGLHRGPVGAGSSSSGSASG